MSNPTLKTPEEQYGGYLSIEDALKLKDEFILLVQSKKLLHFAEKILSKYRKKNYGLPADLTGENVVQELCVEFLRPVKGQCMDEQSELHRLHLYNPAKGTKFETYLYQCMTNLIKTLFDRSNRNPDPISYNNMVDGESENNQFLNIIAVENSLDLPPEAISQIIEKFKKSLTSKLDIFVFDKLVNGVGKNKEGTPGEFKPKAFCQKAADAGKIKNWKRMYARILRSRAQLRLKFIEFINQGDYFKNEVYPDFPKKKKAKTM